MNRIFQYQIAKKSKHAILARIIPGPAFERSVMSDVQASLQALLGSHIQVDVEEVATLPVTKRGKSQIVIDESTEKNVS